LEIKGGNKLFDLIESKQVDKKLSNIIKNIIDYKSESNNEIKMDDSIFVINDTSCSFTDDDALLLIETSYYESDEEENYYLEFNSNKPIDSRPDDLDSLIMYLENTVNGDIQDYSIDDNGFCLNIKFEKPFNSAYFLKQKFLYFNDYKFQIEKQFKQPTTKQTNNLTTGRTIILSNLPIDIDLNTVRLFAENIALNNKVKCLVPSKIFANTYVIHFNDDINCDLMQQRLTRRPQLKNKQIHLTIPVQTNVLLLANYNLHNDEWINDSNHDFKALHKRQSFYFIEFESDKSKHDFEIKLDLHLNDLVYEDLYSYEFLKNTDLITTQLNETKQNETKSILSVLKIPFLILLFVIISFMVKNVKQNSNNETLKQEEKILTIHIDLNEKTDLKFLLFSPQNRLNEIRDDLKELNAILIMNRDDKNKLDIIPWLQIEQVNVDWYLRINKYLNQLPFKANELIIKNPIGTLDRLVYNRLRVELNKLDDLLWNSKYIITGFKDDVDQLVIKIEIENKKNF
jgi:hypothetical protein